MITIMTAISTKKVKEAKINDIIMDRARVEETGQIFGRTFNHLIPEVKGGEITYTIFKTNKRIRMSFNSETKAKLELLLKEGSNPTELSLGRRAGKLWLTMIYIVAKNNGKRRGSFTMKDIIDLWGVQRSGKLYSDIRIIFKSLASVKTSFSYGKGLKRREWGYDFINAYNIIGEGENTTFYFTLDEDALGISTDWLDNTRLSPKNLKKGYLSIPVEELMEKNLSTQYLNFREKLRLCPPGIKKFKVFVILDDWIKVDEDVLRHKTRCHRILCTALAQAKDADELKDYQTHFLSTKDWLNTWEITIEK